MDKLTYIPTAVLLLIGIGLLIGFSPGTTNARIDYRTDDPEAVKLHKSGKDSINAGSVVDLILRKGEEAEIRGDLFWMVIGPLDTMGFHSKKPGMRFSRLGEYRIEVYESQRLMAVADAEVVEGRKVMTETGKTELKAGETFTAIDRSNFEGASKRWKVIDDNGNTVEEKEDVDEFSWHIKSAGNYTVALTYVNEAGEEIGKNLTPVKATAPPPPRRTTTAATPSKSKPPKQTGVLSMATTALGYSYNSSDPDIKTKYKEKSSYSSVIVAKEDLRINHFIVYLGSGQYTFTVAKNGKEVFTENVNLSYDRAWEFGLSKLGRLAENDDVKIMMTTNNGKVFMRPASAADRNTSIFEASFDGGDQWIFNMDMNVKGK